MNLLETSDEELAQFSDHTRDWERISKRADQAAEETNEDSPFLEIGTRSGGASLLMMKAILKSNKPQRWLITVDPYGLKPYMGASMDYGEHHYRRAMKLLSAAAEYHLLNHVHYRMLSLEFMKLWSDPEYEFWFEHNRINNKPFGFAFVDGDHDPIVVAKELDWLVPRMTGDGQILVDDKRFYDGHPELDWFRGLPGIDQDEQMLYWKRR